MQLQIETSTIVSFYALLVGGHELGFHARLVII
jgi:hypothetical protein